MMTTRLATMLMFTLAGSGIIAAAVEDNKTVMRNFYDRVWFQNNLDFADQVLAATTTVHDPRQGGPEQAPVQAQKDVVRAWNSQAGLGGRIDFQVAEGDYVVTRWLWRIRLRGWWQRLLASRSELEIPVVNIVRFENGKVVEMWNHRDDLAIHDQLGASKLYYAEGFFIGVVSALIGSRLLRRKRPSSIPPESS